MEVPVHQEIDGEVKDGAGGQSKSRPRRLFPSD
jgi:hypothetical protein